MRTPKRDLKAAKQQKTKLELESMLRERAKEWTYSSLEVIPDPTYGWTARVGAALPHLAVRYQTDLDYITSRLRLLYELKPEHLLDALHLDEVQALREGLEATEPSAPEAEPTPAAGMQALREGIEPDAMRAQKHGSKTKSS